MISERIKNTVAITLTLIAFFFLLTIMWGSGENNWVYKVYWEKQNGDKMVFEQVTDFHQLRNGMLFMDMRNGEYITISGGLTKVYLIEKRFNWGAWHGKYDY